MGDKMFGQKFLKFIEIWQKDFSIEKTIEDKVSQDCHGNPLPWYTYPAIEFLSQFDYSQKDIFEFGCGNSSLFWAERANSVTSVEDKKDWYLKWQKDFDKTNLQIHLVEDKNLYPNLILSQNKKYDVIIVDAIMREKCTENAIQSLKNGGIIILDDRDRVNTNKEYQNAINLLKKADFLQIDFFGFCPTNVFTKTTSVFFSRNFNFPTLSEFQPRNGIGNLWSMKRKDRKEFYKNQK